MSVTPERDIKFATRIISDHSRICGLVDIKIQQSIRILLGNKVIEHIPQFIIQFLVFIFYTFIRIHFFQIFKIFPVAHIDAFNLIKFFSQIRIVISHSPIEIHQFDINVIDYRFSRFKIKEKSPSSEERFYVASRKSRYMPHDVGNLFSLPASVFYHWFHLHSLAFCKNTKIHQFYQKQRKNYSSVSSPPSRTRPSVPPPQQFFSAPVAYLCSCTPEKGALFTNHQKKQRT